MGGVEGGGARAKGEYIGMSYLGLNEVNARVERGDFRGKKLHSLSASHAQIERHVPTFTAVSLAD